MVENILIQEGLVVVIRGVSEELLKPVGEALYEGGVRIAEIAFQPKDPYTVEKTCRMIAELRQQMDGRMVIGAGTCIEETYVSAAYQAGAQLIVSPDTNPALIRKTKKLGMLSMPGAFTASECVCAFHSGADVVKLFPVTMENLSHLWNLSRPLSHIPFYCFGGSNEENLKEFFRAGACGIGTGISILKQELLERKDYRAITELARRHVEAIRETRRELRPGEPKSYTTSDIFSGKLP